MPPTIGAAIGFITSDPIPDSQSIGAKLRMTAVRGGTRPHSRGEFRPMSALQERHSREWATAVLWTPYCIHCQEDSDR